jgi:hypothetical protein
MQHLLFKSSAVVFRGFDIKNEHGYQKFFDVISAGKAMDYTGGTGTGRTKITKDIVEVTPVPSYMSLPLHNEMSYSSKFPSQMCFFCEIAPKHRGETTIADNRKISKEIPENILEKFIKKGVMYNRYYYNKKPIFDYGIKNTWVNTFNSSNKADIEKICTELSLDYKWIDGGLKTWNKLPGYIVHPFTKETVLFNHLAVLIPQNFIKRVIYNFFVFPKESGMTYGDGEKIDEYSIETIHKKINQATILHKWKVHDILWIDNILCMHGRAPFKGERRILAGMIK